MTRDEYTRRRPDNLVLRTAVPAAFFAVVWWVLNEGDLPSWVLGVPVVSLATLLSLAVVPPSIWRISPFGLLRFAVYFLVKSLLSGVDVAGRVLRPRMPLQPGLVRYRQRLQPEAARVAMANAASLMPGTLSVDLQAGELVVHALDTDAPVMDELRQLEENVAGLYGVRLTEETP